MPSSRLADLPPRPWEAGVASSETNDDRDLGLERPWDRSTPNAHRSEAPSGDAFVLFELLRRSARGLHAVANRLDHEDPSVRSRARIAAAANLFYALGALSSRGVVLPRALPGVLDAPDPSMLLLASSACHLLAEEMERFVVRLADGSRPPPGELARLVDRVEECWNHVTNDGDAGLVR